MPNNGLDRSKEQSEIDAMHREGFHFIGDWHTHPEPTPTASSSDLNSIRDAFAKSKHHLNWFIMIIAGVNEFPSGLYVAVHNAKSDIRLMTEKSSFPAAVDGGVCAEFDERGDQEHR